MSLARPNEPWLNYVANGEAYSAENFLIGLGGTFAQIQLFNPVASGKRIRLRSVHSIAVTFIAASVVRHDVALATLGLPVGFIVENLLGGGAAEVAEMRSDQPIAVAGSVFWVLNAPGNTPALYPPHGREWGQDLLEGQGIHIAAGAGITSIINWMWAEVDL